MASADTLIVGGPVTGTTLTIKDSALTALNSGWANGVTAYIDPYHGTLNGQAVTLFCIDPNHLDNSNPSGYPVTVSPGGTGNSTLQALNVSNSGVVPGTGSISNAALAVGFSNNNVSQLYAGLAYLSAQLQNSSSSLTQQEYQAAIWQLGDYTSSFSVVNAPAGFSASQVLSFEQTAFANSGQFANSFEIVTDSSEVTNGKNAGQEYLILTPEPSSILLSMSGLLGFFTFRRRKTS
jgi:hypothetical protein